MAGRYDIRFRQGDTKVIPLTFLVSVDPSVPYDLTDKTFGMQIKAEPGGPVLVDCASGFVVTDAAAGAVTLTITSTQTATLSVPNSCGGRPARYVYDLQITDDNTLETQTWLYGDVWVTAEITT